MAEKKATTAKKPKIATKKADENITVEESTTPDAVSIDESAESSEKFEPTDAPMESHNPIEPTTKVRLAKKHDCCIGGTHYHFEAGNVYDVPVNVAIVLRRGDLVRPV